MTEQKNDDKTKKQAEMLRKNLILPKKQVEERERLKKEKRLKSPLRDSDACYTKGLLFINGPTDG